MFFSMSSFVRLYFDLFLVMSLRKNVSFQKFNDSTTYICYASYFTDEQRVTDEKISLRVLPEVDSSKPNPKLLLQPEHDQRAKTKKEREGTAEGNTELGPKYGGGPENPGMGGVGVTKMA